MKSRFMRSGSFLCWKEIDIKGGVVSCQNQVTQKKKK